MRTPKILFVRIIARPFSDVDVNDSTYRLHLARIEGALFRILLVSRPNFFNQSTQL